MSAVLIAAAIAAIKARLLAELENFKKQLPDGMKGLADQVGTWLSGILDAVDVAALEADISGRLILLLKEGKGPSSSQPVDLA